MTDSETPTTDTPQVDPDAISSIMVGHAISKLDDEAAVCISVNEHHVRLSPEGARIVAAQITAWADHAEKYNQARPTAAITKLIYRVVGAVGKDKAWGEAPPTEWTANPPAEMADEAAAAAAAAPREEAIVVERVAATPKKPARKRTKSRTAKKSVRKAKR